MRCITRHTDYESRTDTFRLIVLSDLHCGNIHSNDKAIRTLVREIADDPFCYWIGLGDYCECINIHDPRQGRTLSRHRGGIVTLASLVAFCETE